MVSRTCDILFQALHGWPRNLSTTTLPFARKDKNADRDFMALNKAAVQNGLVTAGENYEFRATHDVRRKTAGSENTRLRTRRIPPTMVFGISTRYLKYQTVNSQLYIYNHLL